MRRFMIPATLSVAVQAFLLGVVAAEEASTQTKKAAGAKATLVVEDVGAHDFPVSAYPAVRSWLREAVTECDEDPRRRVAPMIFRSRFTI